MTVLGAVFPRFCPDKRDVWHGKRAATPCQTSCLSGRCVATGGGPHFLTTEYNAIPTWLRCAHAGIVQNKKHQLTNERLKQSDCTAAERTIAVYKTVTRYLCERQQEAQLSLKPNAQRKNQLSSTAISSELS